MAIQEITGLENGNEFIGKLNDNFEELGSVTTYKGLKYVALGDSITYGFIPRNCDGYIPPGSAGYPAQLDSYAKLTAERLGMDFVNAGVTGSTVTNMDGRSPMCTRYSQLPDDADVITVMGGTNDIALEATLGTMADRGTDTFYGALHTLLQGLYTKYIGGVTPSTGKKRKIIVCTPLKLLDKNKSSDANTIANNADALIQCEDFIEAIKEVAAFYSFPVLDFYNLSGINPHLDRTLHGTVSGYTGYYNPYITDGSHPTQEGASMMADVLVGFLKGLK